MSQEESWSDVAEMCDTNATYETESFKCKALRKYAAYHGKELQNVTMDEVAQSPQGLQGWGEMDVIVRGVNLRACRQHLLHLQRQRQMLPLVVQGRATPARAPLELVGSDEVGAAVKKVI